MELSDKALRLIGLRLLEGRANRSGQLDPIPSATQSIPSGYGRPRLTQAARLNVAQAPILASRNKKSKD